MQKAKTHSVKDCSFDGNKYSIEACVWRNGQPPHDEQDLNVKITLVKNGALSKIPKKLLVMGMSIKNSADDALWNIPTCILEENSNNRRTFVAHNGPQWNFDSDVVVYLDIEYDKQSVRLFKIEKIGKPW